MNREEGNDSPRLTGHDENDIVLECRGVSHWFGDKKVLGNVNLRIGRGQIVALVGFGVPMHRTLR